MAAVHAAINGVENLTSLITDQISILTDLNLFRKLKVCQLSFRLRGSYNFSDGMTIMKLPVMPVYTIYDIVPVDSSQKIVFISTESGSITAWWLSGQQTVDIMATITFLSV